MPLVDQIIASHRIDPVSTPFEVGEIVQVSIDAVYVQDGNSPTIARIFAEYGFDRVFDPERIALFFDHTVLSGDRQMTNRLREAERFAESLGLRVFRAGRGISHLVALEEGWFEPGSIVLGADSHTCTGGVRQCLALGMGASDIASAMVTGSSWLQVPATTFVHVSGTPHSMTSAKDVMLHLLAEYRQEPFLYRSLEWGGEWVEGLDAAGRVTVANMAVELGAKCTFLPPTDGHEGARFHLEPVKAHTILEVDVAGLEPYVAKPHSPFAGEPLGKCAGVTIDYVFAGSCANSSYGDLEELVRGLNGESVNSRVNLVVSPGSAQIYGEAIRNGLLDKLLDAGAIVSPPGCGACVGTQGIVPADGDRVLSTMNRNFLGRMGNPKASIWLSSPRIAGRAAVLGQIPSVEEL